MFPWLVKDIGKIINRGLFTQWTPPEWKAYDTDREALSVIQQLHGFPLLALDIETDVEKDTSFTHPKAILCIAISYAPNKAVVLGERALASPNVRERLKELLHAKLTLCHNGKYDLQVLLRFGYLDYINLYADTMLASYVLDERGGGHSLGACASEILGAPDWKSEVKIYTKGGESYRNIPTPLLHQYNAWDVSQTFLLWQYYEREMGRQSMRHVHDMLVEMSNELTYVELEGIKLDEAYVEELSTQFSQQLGQLEEALSPWVANPRSPLQVAKALKKLGVPHVPSTDEDHLGQYIKYTKSPELVRFIQLMLEHRKAAKLYGTYVIGNQKLLIDGRVYPSLLLHGTVFGRLAARNPNIHNQPRDKTIRRMYVPAEGNTFVQGDYSQAELRVIACEAEDKFLIDVFNDPSRDIHHEVGDTLYGIGKHGEEERVRTKAFVFGSAYGREYFSIAEEYNLPAGVAQRLQEGFFSMIPDTMRWRQSVQDEVFKQGKALQTHFGRKRRFHLITRENKPNIAKECLAFKPQSIASDICQLSLGRLRREFGWSEHAPKIRITVHDSILVECAKAEEADVQETLRRVCANTARELYSDLVPFAVDAKSGPSWGDLS